MYHWVDSSLGERLRPWGVLPGTFQRQMEHLKRSGRVTIGLDALAAHLESAAPLPEGAVVLTFDDGYLDLDRTVRPVLERHGFTATVFVVTGHAGGTNAWDARHGDPPRPLLGWEAIRRLDGRVFRFESHSCTHPFLTVADLESARSEIEESKRRLEDVLRREVTTFSYPHGLFDAVAERMVRAAGYRCAVTDERGLNRPGIDPFRVRRVMIGSADGASSFWWKLRTGHDLRGAARLLVRRRRP